MSAIQKAHDQRCRGCGKTGYGEDEFLSPRDGLCSDCSPGSWKNVCKRMLAPEEEAVTVLMAARQLAYFVDKPRDDETKADIWMDHLSSYRQSLLRAAIKYSKALQKVERGEL